MNKDNLGMRMKVYESVSQNLLIRRTPVIVRLDGKAFHTFTKGAEKPFDKNISDAMAMTTLTLCKEMQGAVFAYTQSDEISILLQDWKTLTTDAWYANNVQKIVSVSASVATANFNSLYKKPTGTLALFDSRAYNLPFSEVANYFLWRQADATRNSVSGLAQSQFSHKQLHGKSSSQMMDMLMAKGINWNDVETRFKRGVCVVPFESSFKIDLASPIFIVDRNYIESNFNFKE